MSQITTRPIQTLSIATALLVVVVVVAYGRLASRPTKEWQATYPAITGNPSSQSVTDQLEVELITLRPTGFEPLEITRPKGPFVLLVDDRSGKQGSSLKLQRVKGERLRDVNTNRGKSEWSDAINLPPGDYVLTDAGESGSRCQITILP